MLKNTPPTVSVIIPTIGRNTLAECQAALAQQTRPPDEVIIVIDEARRGPGWARNEGVKRATGNLIAFTDDDCIPPADWLEQLVKVINDYQAAGAGGTYLETDPFLNQIRQRRQIPETTQIDTVGWVGTGGNIMYRRAWLDQCAETDGYIFNETFRHFGAEDFELAWRLRQRGGRLVFVANKITHLRRVTPLSYLRHQFNRGVGVAKLFKIQKNANTSISPQPSLIWGQPTGPRWLTAVWSKAIGPLDIKSFTTPRYFWLFWLGEKSQGLGFLWGLR